jgi:hypothetical protein
MLDKKLHPTDHRAFPSWTNMTAETGRGVRVPSEHAAENVIDGYHTVRDGWNGHHLKGHHHRRM